MSDIDVCAVDELAEGEHVVVDIGGGIEVAVYLVDGEYYAIEDVCTHDNGPLAEGELEGHQVVCPRHGAKFDLRTGKATALPAYMPIETYPVRAESGRVLLSA